MSFRPAHGGRAVLGIAAGSNAGGADVAHRPTMGLVLVPNLVPNLVPILGLAARA
jgi:hypothetical protein